MTSQTFAVHPLAAPPPAFRNLEPRHRIGAVAESGVLGALRPAVHAVFGTLGQPEVGVGPPLLLGALVLALARPLVLVVCY